MATEYEHQVDVTPDLIALGDEASALLGQPLAVVWRSQQEVEGTLVEGLVAFIDTNGERVDVSEADFVSLLSNTTPVVTARDTLLTALDAATTLTEVKAVVQDFINDTHPG